MIPLIFYARRLWKKESDMIEANQNPEQIARDKIDALLRESGWLVQSAKKIDLQAGTGIAVREYQTDIGFADYALFVNKRAVGVIEAKPQDWGHKITTVEEQSGGYAEAKLKWVSNNQPLPFVYESTGIITRFRDGRDPKPRSREIFSFHRPETLLEWVTQPSSLRERLQYIPPLQPDKLRDCQVTAIKNLEQSFKQDKPRALVQMATGAGKTFTAITSVYRLLKYGNAKRVLFLVDTKNLGEQAEQEFMSYVPNDDNRKFTELYNVQRLKSSFMAKDAQVCICTIQRMYSMLRDEELDEFLEIENPEERTKVYNQPNLVVYNPKIPPEFFDFIFIDECHRSIYNLWQQVLDYFDASLIGLTATPDNRTCGFFKKNIVSKYTHEKAVADGVNVGNEIYTIETEISQQGAKIKAQQQIEKRERMTRKKRWERQDEEESYSHKQLDRDIVNPDQIRTVIRTFKEKLPEIFPNRKEVPKTLIFAKTDSHADDIIQTVREEFGEGNDFCRKITHQAKDPKSELSSFRNDYNPRIAVTVDMIATGTDVKPLECLLFMRDVKSRNYFEQMKGRGTRTLDHDNLKKVTPSASSAKTHYVIVDAIGVTKSLKTASQPLITKPSVPLKDLAMAVMMGTHDEDTVSSLAGRLARLEKQLDARDQERITEKTGGIHLTDIVGGLISAIDPDRVDAHARDSAKLPEHAEPDEKQRNSAQEELVSHAANVFNGELIELLENIRRDKEQTIDHENLDSVIRAEWDGDAKENATLLTLDFQEYLEANRDEIEALTIFYSQPARRREITFDMIRQVMEKLRSDKPKLAPIRVWRAYAVLDEVKSESPANELTALVSLIRRACGIDKTVSGYSDTVRRNFQNWIMQHHSGGEPKFNKEQMEWLHMIRDHIVTSFHIERSDLESTPFDAKGGMGKMYQLFGDRMEPLLEELNEVLAA
jgi:type I restriction enzyme R subunit